MTLNAVASPPTTDSADPAASSHVGRTVGTGGSARFITGEAISIDLPVAQLGSRMLARLIDMIIQVMLYVALSALIMIVFGMAAAAGLLEFDGNLAQGIFIIVAAVVLVGYPVIMETFGGRTVGKITLGLRVVRDDGGPIRFRQAITRGLVGAAIEWPGLLGAPLSWLACLWTMAISPQGKRLGDFAAGTLVIHDRTPNTWGRLPLMPPGLIGWATTLDLAGLDDDLALAVRHYLVRMPKLREPARTQIGHRLMAEVAAVTRPAPPPGVPAWAYLAAVHAERSRRFLHRLVGLRSRSALVWPIPPQPASVAQPPPAVTAQPPGAPYVRSAVPQQHPVMRQQHQPHPGSITKVGPDSDPTKF